MFIVYSILSDRSNKSIILKFQQKPEDIYPKPKKIEDMKYLVHTFISSTPLRKDRKFRREKSTYFFFSIYSLKQGVTQGRR